jgi:hypothetical protein
MNRVIALAAIVMGWGALVATAQEAGAIRVDTAYFHVDVGGRYPWSEYALGLVDLDKTDQRSGLLKVHVCNGSTVPVPVEAESLNGTALESLRTSEKHEVIWWRTWPNPVPPRGYAEVSVRLRYPLEADARLSLRAGAQVLEAAVPKTPPPYRIETVGWTGAGRRLTIVAQRLPGDARPTSADAEDARSRIRENSGVFRVGQRPPQPPNSHEFGYSPSKSATSKSADLRLKKVFLDGRDVTDRAQLLSPEFFQGVCPVVVQLDKELKPGSFHTYKLQTDDGTALACTLRTLDEFLRLGLYGAGDLADNVRRGITEASHFHTQTRAQLDEYLRFGVRNAFHIGEAPAADVVGHPAVHAYLLHDEPDVWDAGSPWPEPLRIGFHGPDIVAATHRCAATDPVKPVMSTLDLTYKPGNYYVYAQIPDIVSPDCYPLTHAQPLRWVREVTDACRLAAGPHRVEIIPQVNWEDRAPDMKFRRPPFPAEVWIQYLYGLGAGARGFSGYEWYDEGNHHGAKGYPGVMEAVGQTFRRFQLVAPLILQAHPTTLATCDREKVWLKTLVCGPDLLLVAVNDDYESLPADVQVRAQQQVEIRLPNIPWLKPTQALQVDDGSFTKLELASLSDGTRLALPTLKVGQVIVVTGDERLSARLLARYRTLRTGRR